MVTTETKRARGELLSVVLVNGCLYMRATVCVLRYENEYFYREQIHCSYEMNLHCALGLGVHAVTKQHSVALCLLMLIRHPGVIY